MSRPAWLPEVLVLDGDWKKTVEALYQVFIRDVKTPRLMLHGCNVIKDLRILPDEDYEETFWHLIDRGKAPDRLPDFDRARRLSWFRPMLEHTDDSEVRYFEKVEGRRVRAFLWLFDFDYLIVFDKKEKKWGVTFFLCSAHYVEPGRKRKLEKWYQEYSYKKTNAAP